MKISNRREFLKCCSLAVGAGCLGKIDLSGAEKKFQDKKLDLDELTYCAWKCSPETCVMLKATQDDNEELRKKAFEISGFKEKFGVEYDKKLVFCHTCKEENKPQNMMMKACEVKNCAVERGVRSCVECKDLSGCKKETWVKYPQQKAYALKLQKQWIEQEKKALI